MDSSRLITLAIHTFDYAVALKALLEQEGVCVELNNVNLDLPEVSPGVRVRIREADLPLALRIVENRQLFERLESRVSDSAPKILIPTDFSPLSLAAAKTGFRIASRLGLEVEFLHSFLQPSARESIQLSPAYDYELARISSSRKLRKEADARMASFVDSVRQAVKSGEIPGVNFSSVIVEGLPEDAILEYTRRNKPHMVVMGTRATDQKETDLIGSVTAEVLDSCRVAAFTIPENMQPDLMGRIHSVALLCSLDQEDILALDALHRLFPDTPLDITLLHVSPRRFWPSNPDNALRNLLLYACSHYPAYTFSAHSADMATPIPSLSASAEFPFDLLCIPNRRKHAIARVFNPGLAHKLLFSADIPLFAVPV